MWLQLRLDDRTARRETPWNLTDRQDKAACGTAGAQYCAANSGEWNRMSVSIRSTAVRAGMAAALVLGSTVALEAASPAEAQAATPHYWYLKPGGWKWTSDYAKYAAYVQAGGIGNGTHGPDFAKKYHPPRTVTVKATQVEKPMKPSFKAELHAHLSATALRKPATPVHQAPKFKTKATHHKVTPHKKKPTAIVAPSNGSMTEKAIAFAEKQLGDPYVYGATGPNAWDCSGLVQAAFRSAGKSLPRTAAEQAGRTHRISSSQRRRGDLVFWSSGGNVYHVGIYIGGGKYIAAPKPGSSVRIETTAGYPPSFYGRL